MKVAFLRCGTDFRLELNFGESEAPDMEQLLQIIPLFATAKDIEPARAWARIYKEIHGHRYIATGVMEWWMVVLAKEGLILEADSKEEHRKMLALERMAYGN
jgi:hypothetical protein